MEATNQMEQETEANYDFVLNQYNFPEDVLPNILCRLPLQTLLRFKSVCRRWSSLIQDPIFMKLHSDQSSSHIPIFKRDDIYFDGHLHLYPIEREGEASCFRTNGLPHSYARVAHCYGLLCFRTQVKKTFYVCNPSTRSQIELPKSSSFSSTFGLGFISSTNTYAVVQISYWDGCHVFTLGTSLWREISSRPANYNFYGESFFYKGALHWNGHDMIISFDLESEKFGVIPYPDDKLGFFHDLHELEGCLCVISGLVVNQNTFDFWLLKDYMNHVWVKHSFKLPLVLSPKGDPRVVIQNGLILTTSHNINPTHNLLHVYDTQNHMSNTVELPRFLSGKSILMIGNYVENLIALRDS